MRQYPRSHGSHSWLGQALAILCVVSVVAAISIPIGPGPADDSPRYRQTQSGEKESHVSHTPPRHG